MKYRKDQTESKSSMTLMKKIGIFFVSARLLNVDELSSRYSCMLVL